jgi:protein phosphatase
MRYALLSDRGRTRENNEDRALALPAVGLFVIADGMGGHVAGEVASRLAVESFAAAFEQQPRPRRTRDEAARLERALGQANTAVLQEAQRASLHGMGTTLTAVLVRGRSAVLAHVGDTRAYFVRPQLLQRVTRDHTVVDLMQRSGLLGEEAARVHPERHMLLQALGTQEELEPDVFQARIPGSARILLSSDGLHDVVPAAELLACALQRDLDQAVKELVAAANAHGGPDNVTALLIEP